MSWNNFAVKTICQEFLNNQTQDGYITFIDKVQNLPEIAALKDKLEQWEQHKIYIKKEYKIVKDKLHRRNMQIKELKTKLNSACVSGNVCPYYNPNIKNNR